MALCRRYEASVHRFLSMVAQQVVCADESAVASADGCADGWKARQVAALPHASAVRWLGDSPTSLLDVKGMQVRCSMWPLARTRREPRSPRRWGGGDYLEQSGPVTESGLLTEPLLDAGEAARLLRVPRSTLYELVRTRGLPHIRIGDRGLRFTRQDLETWVMENTYGTRRAR